MRYLVGFLCVCALGVVPLVGCGQSLGPMGDGGSGGSAGDGGSGGMAGSGGSGGTTGQVFPCTEQGIRDAIAEGGGPHTFSCAEPQTVETDAEIVIDNDVVLDGGGELTVGGNEEHRVFSVPEGVTVELGGLAVIGGFANGDPQTEERQGGGIYNNGTLTLTNSTVSRNTAVSVGGGISNYCGTVTLTNSTVSGNTVVGGEGGGILTFGTLTLTNSTVSDNAAGSGSAIYAPRSPGETCPPMPFSVEIANSLIRGDCAQEEQSGATWTSIDYDIESPGNTCGFDPDGTDQVSVSADDLKLGELADHGGPTMTHALEEGSPAINQIPEADCEVMTDQRGLPRPETGGTKCDVGAFEVQPEP